MNCLKKENMKAFSKKDGSHSYHDKNDYLFSYQLYIYVRYHMTIICIVLRTQMRSPYECPLDVRHLENRKFAD